jgi:hypothetical protein
MGKTSSSTWKSFERQVASFFGTTRTPLSGMCENLTKADTLHDHLFIECKLRSEFSIVGKYIAHTERLHKEKNPRRPKKGESPVPILPPVLRVANGLRYKEGDLWVFSYAHLELVANCVLVGTEDNGNIRRMVLKNRMNFIEGEKADAILSLYADTEMKAKKENKVPVVAIKRKNTVGWLLAVNPAYIPQVKTIMLNHNGTATTTGTESPARG